MKKIKEGHMKSIKNFIFDLTTWFWSVIFAQNFSGANTIYMKYGLNNIRIRYRRRRCRQRPAGCFMYCT